MKPSQKNFVQVSDTLKINLSVSIIYKTPSDLVSWNALKYEYCTDKNWIYESSFRLRFEEFLESLGPSVLFVTVAVQW